MATHHVFTMQHQKASTCFTLLEAKQAPIDTPQQSLLNCCCCCATSDEENITQSRPFDYKTATWEGQNNTEEGRAKDKANNESKRQRCLMQERTKPHTRK